MHSRVLNKIEIYRIGITNLDHMGLALNNQKSHKNVDINYSYNNLDHMGFACLSNNNIY